MRVSSGVVIAAFMLIFLIVITVLAALDEFNPEDAARTLLKNKTSCEEAWTFYETNEKEFCPEGMETDYQAVKCATFLREAVSKVRQSCYGRSR